MSELWRGAGKKLDQWDYGQIARTIGAGEDHIRAFCDVEASGKAFDQHGRLKMLFEPHWFYRLLSIEKTANGKRRYLSTPKREKAVAAGLAYPSYRPGSYPKDSYPRLIAAIQIDETAALKSCSWGLGQIMGFNHAMVGYRSVHEMVKAFADDEEKQLEAIVAYLKKTKLDDDLRAGRWDVVANGYNGKASKTNNYAQKLARRHAYWQSQPDVVPPKGAADRLPENPKDPEQSAPKAAEPKADQVAPPVSISPVERISIGVGVGGGIAAMILRAIESPFVWAALAVMAAGVAFIVWKGLRK